MATSQGKATRGEGLFEEFLARKRSQLADTIIPEEWRNGRILDIGCGVHPQFLLNTRFAEKHALDKIFRPDEGLLYESHNIRLINCDVEKQERLPYDSNHFDIVTMLAVVEHLKLGRLVHILVETHRVLKPGRMYIMTTPPLWTRLLLAVMARLRLVSPDEIDEHKYAYPPSTIVSALQEAGFSKKHIRIGYFELGMNMWATAIK